MKFSDTEIDEATQEAIAFFNETFGIDFSGSEPDELGRRFSGNASTFFAYFPPEIDYHVSFNRWIVSGITQSLCFKISQGGFLVFFAEQQLLHGIYGGPEGRLINPGEELTWGYYSVPVCPQQPLVIQFQSNTPIRREEGDGFMTINYDVYSRTLGKGAAMGLFAAFPRPDDPSIAFGIIRNVFTFPAHPGLT